MDDEQEPARRDRRQRRCAVRHASHSELLACYLKHTLRQKYALFGSMSTA